jgi:hypothetical protein
MGRKNVKILKIVYVILARAVNRQSHAFFGRRDVMNVMAKAGNFLPAICGQWRSQRFQVQLGQTA